SSDLLAGGVDESAGALIGAGLEPRVLGGSVPLHPGGQLLRTVEETGLGLGAVHPGLQGDHALSEVLVAGGQLVQPGGQLIAAGGRAVGSAGELIETVGQLTGAIGGLAGAVRQAPHAAGELAGALGGLLGALVELLGSAVEF